MGCWKILGIEKTDNIREIKKAYAIAAKKYHPEENQDAFLNLNKAYKVALLIAAGEISDNPVVTKAPQKKEQRKATGAHDENMLDYDELIEEGMQENYEDDEEDFDDGEDELDYEELIKTVIQNDSRIPEEIMSEIDSLYMDMERKNKAAEWEAVFMSAAFKNYLNDRDFTIRVLNYFMLHRDISNRVFRSVLVPVMKEWKALWLTDNELEMKFMQMMQPINKDRNASGLKKVIAVVGIIVSIVGAYHRFGRIANSVSNIGGDRNNNSISDFVKEIQPAQYSKEHVKMLLKSSVLFKKDYIDAGKVVRSHVSEEEYNKLLILATDEDAGQLEERMDEILGISAKMESEYIWQ